MELVEIFNIICQNIEPMWNSQLCHIIVLTLVIFISFLCVGKGVLYYLLKRKNKTEHHWRQKYCQLQNYQPDYFLAYLLCWRQSNCRCWVQFSLYHYFLYRHFWLILEINTKASSHSRTRTKWITLFKCSPCFLSSCFSLHCGLSDSKLLPTTRN